MAGELFDVYNRIAFHASEPLAYSELPTKGAVVKLKCADNEELEFPPAAACLSNRLRSLIANGGTDDAIPVPLNKKLMAKVIEYLVYHRDIPGGQIVTPLQSDNLADCGASKWDALFLNVDKETLFDLNLAANLLEIPSLFFLTGVKIALMVRDKPAAKLFKEFQIKNDLPNSEEEAVNDKLTTLKEIKKRNYPLEDALAGNSAVLQAITAAADRCGVLKMEQEGDAGKLDSWRHAMWRTAVLLQWEVLEVAPSEILNDRELFLGAIVASSGAAMALAPVSFRKDRGIVLEAVRHSAKTLDQAHSELQGDRGFVLECIKVNAATLKFASDALRSDKDLILEAAKGGHGSALQGAKKDLQANEEFVLKVVGEDPQAFAHVADELFSSRDFAVKAAQRNGFALKHMSSLFQADHEIVLAAVQSNPAAALFAHTSRRQELGLMMPWDSQVSLSVDRARPSAMETRIYKAEMPGGQGLNPCFKATKFVQYSAGSTLAANMGQSNYVAANNMLDKLVWYDRPEIDSVSNMWGAVKGIGMRWKAFASADFLADSAMAISVEECRAIINAVIVPMDPPEWVYWQCMEQNPSPYYTTPTANFGTGGGWKPSEATAPPPPAKSPRPAKRETKDKPGAAAPLGGWPGLVASARVEGPAVFVEGAPVALVKNGMTGVLVKKLENGRWKVKLDNGKGNGLLKEEYLRLRVSAEPAMVQETCSTDLEVDTATSEVGKCEEAPRMAGTRYCIVGSWDNFALPREMTWDQGRQCYVHDAHIVRVCGVGGASFQILLEGSWGACLHPAERVSDGRPGQDYAVEGPDPKGQCYGKFWQVGGLQGVSSGTDRYQIRLFLSEDGTAAKKVNWVNLDTMIEHDGKGSKWCTAGEGWHVAGEVAENVRRAEEEKFASERSGRMNRLLQIK